MAGLEDKSSANYHHWLTAEEFGEWFGLPERELEQVTGWLAESGLSVEGVYPNRLTIDFSATAGQVRAVFGTEMHAYDVDGVRHLANASDPEVPSRLAARIAGVVSLHDFRPESQLRSRRRGIGGSAGGSTFTMGSGEWAEYAVTASDLATIYNLTPLFKAGITGKGETIALVEDSDVYSTADWNAFRAAFGLAGYTSGTLTEVHPSPARGMDNCADPGAITGWDEEPILDAEYASAAAPGAAIEIAACRSSGVTAGVVIALTNLVNASGAHPAALSVSYGTCEAANGAAANAAIAADYEQAVAEGISVFAAAGDGGAAFCDEGAVAATHGIGVNAYASTVFDVAVGGTDFADTYAHTSVEYWNAANSGQGASAKSYIPEIPWDDSCASPMIAEWNGYGIASGAAGFCLADALTDWNYQAAVAGSGGPSGCATGNASLSEVVSWTCRGTAKPAWQSVTGNPRDGVRDLPDVALFAGDGIWNHAYIFCDSNLNDEDGAPCKAGEVADWSEGGGTSFAAPIMAGIQALVTQKWGRQGNPNPVYYKLAVAQFDSATLKGTCLASKGAESGSGCVFHDVAAGSSDVNCAGPVNCYGYVLSMSVFGYDPAYMATAGWDFATGLGSVNAYNLVMSSGW
jgi:subtilase family serine protease